MSEWNFNISEAPRGKIIPVKRLAKTSSGTVEIKIDTFAPDWLWIATKCDKVLKTHWKPKDDFGGDRFIGLNKGEQPVAWQHFVVPVHPHFSAAERQTEAAES